MAHVFTVDSTDPVVIRAFDDFLRVFNDRVQELTSEKEKGEDSIEMLQAELDVLRDQVLDLQESISSLEASLQQARG